MDELSAREKMLPQNSGPHAKLLRNIPDLVHEINTQICYANRITMYQCFF